MYLSIWCRCCPSHDASVKGRRDAESFLDGLISKMRGSEVAIVDHLFVNDNHQGVAPEVEGMQATTEHEVGNPSRNDVKRLQEVFLGCCNSFGLTLVSMVQSCTSKIANRTVEIEGSEFIVGNLSWNDVKRIQEVYLGFQ
ncbi:hypothetical protein L2E82_02716 [Cichorium intybus]|uniref:Uncharacterized protein n=1 Tax=Cichorium intybus TaxID=13427 RepID=A0ACB9H3I3_CICIN|nr:hypothetical protein L2E82_02716 [Cichorium intybus]